MRISDWSSDVCSSDLIDAFNARKATLDKELQTKATEIQNAQKTAGANSATLQPKIEAFQKRRAEIQQELATLGRPIALAQAYVEEQVSSKMGDALKSAMTKNKVDLRSEEHTSELQSLMRISYAVF